MLEFSPAQVVASILTGFDSQPSGEMPVEASTCKEVWNFESSTPRQAAQFLLTAVVRWLQRTGVQEPARSLPPAADIVRKYAQSLRTARSRRLPCWGRRRGSNLSWRTLSARMGALAIPDIAVYD